MDTLRSNKMIGNTGNHAYQRGQEDQNKILADHFIYFLNIDVVLAHRGRSDDERHGQRQVGGHRHQGIAITMLLIHHVEHSIALREMPALLLRVRIT